MYVPRSIRNVHRIIWGPTGFVGIPIQYVTRKKRKSFWSCFSVISTCDLRILFIFEKTEFKK